VERRQAVVLYVLAVVVAFGAVLGAWYVAARFLGDGEEERAPARLTLVTLTAAPDPGKAVAAALIVRDPAIPGSTLYVIPRELLLAGPGGEYVFAADSMATGDLQADLERVMGVPVDAAYTLPASALGEIADVDALQVELGRPVALLRNGVEHAYKDRVVIAASEITEMAATSGSGGYDGTTVQEGLWTAVLQAGALRPGSARSQTVGAIASGASGSSDSRYLEEALNGLLSGEATVARMPSTSRVAEGQFAFVPDPEGIMAGITRKGSGYHSRFTVVVRNGSGKVGIGEAVARRLATLDVNLPATGNADRFDYRQTRILAGSGALSVAEDIRVILGRGVVLNGADVAPDTVLVIVGADLEAEDLKPKDQP
jgi:hypothetical protein